MSFGYQKPLDTGNFWNFSGQFLPLIFFKDTPFFSPNFRYKIFHSNFPLQYFSVVFNFSRQLSSNNFFSPVYRPKIFYSKISITIFQFFLCYACSLLIFQIEFFTRGGVRVRHVRWSHQAPWFRGRHLFKKKKILEWSPFTAESRSHF